MSYSLAEVQSEDFMKFGREKPSHLLIEEILISMGGGGTAGGQFKKDMLKLAGWTGGSLTTYASRSAVAAEAFNRIRDALETASDAESLKSVLAH